MTLLDLPIPKEFSRSLIHAAARHGIGILPVVRQLQLHDQSSPWLSVRDLYALISFLMEQGEFHSFLPILSDIELSGIEEVVTLSIASASLRETLNHLLRLGVLRHYGIHLELIDTGSEQCLRCVTDPALPVPLQRAIVDSAFCMFRRIIVPLLGENGAVTEVRLASARPDCVADYAVYFATPVSSNCAHDELVLRSGTFDVAFSSRCPELQQHALQALAEKAKLLNRQQGIVSRLSLWLSELETLNETDIADAAAHMGIAVRSLQLRLSEHDTTFSRIKAQCLIERSKKLLQSPQLSVDRVAEQVGFSDTTAFRRAFKRVEGISPSEFRKQWRR